MKHCLSQNIFVLFVFLLISPSSLFGSVYPLYIPQDEDSHYVYPNYLVENAVELRISDYRDAYETLPSIPYPETIQEDGCIFLQNTLFNLITGQTCSNSCGNMCYSSCGGSCGETCGGPVKWYAAQAVEGMYISGSGDFINVGDCYLSYEYRVKVRGCSNEWKSETNCGSPADCNGLTWLNTGLSLTPIRPGGFPNYDPAIYTTLDFSNLEVDVNIYGRAYVQRRCSCGWSDPFCCLCPEGTIVMDTLNDRHATADPADAKAVLKAVSCICGQPGCVCNPSDSEKTKISLNIPWMDTNLNNFNINIFNWNCDLWGWNPCRDLANWLNGLISDWIRGMVEDAVDDAIRNELGSGFEYILDIPPDGTNPFDIVLAPPVKGGLDFISDQLRGGLEGDLKDTLVGAFEGFHFAENNYYVADLAGCAVYADIDVTVRGCYDASGNIKPIDYPPVGCYWLSDGLSELHPGGDPADSDGLTYQRAGVSLTSDPPGFTQVDNALYTTLQLYDLELDVDARFTVRFAPGDPYCNWVGNYFFPQRTGVINATARGIAQIIFNGSSVALDFSNFTLNVNDLYISAINWSCCAPSQANCQWDICQDISRAANLFLSQYAVTLLGDMLNQEIDSLLRAFFDKDGDGNPDPLFDLNDLLAELPLGDIGLRLGLFMNLNTSPAPPFGATLSLNAGLFPVSYHPCVPYASSQGLEYTESPPPVFTDYVPKSQDLPFMIGAEISDDFVNQALFSLYAAGFLCVDIDPESKGLISIAGKSLDDFLSALGFSGDIISEDITSIASTFLNTNSFAFILPSLYEYAPDSPIKIVLRPSRPPLVRFGVNGDTMRITLEDFNIDLYTYMDGRELRALSFKSSASLGFTINSLTLMSADPSASLIDITVGEPEITSILTFNELIPVNKADLEAVVVNLMRLVAPLLAGFISGIPPVLTPPGVDPEKIEGDLFGLTIENTYVVTDVPDSSQSYDNYLGLFFNLGGELCWSCLLEGFSFSLPPLSPRTVSGLSPAPLFTYSKDRKGIKHLAGNLTYTIFTEPKGVISVTSPDDGGNYKYSYRIDNGLWSNYSDRGELVLSNLLEGTHLVEVRALARDGRRSEKSSIVVRVDSLPPSISIRRGGWGNDLIIGVSDLQTEEGAIKTSWRWDEGNWSEFSLERKVPAGSLSPGTHRLEVRALDDVGNLSSISTVVEISNSEGCGCNAQSGSTGNIYSFLLLVVGFILFRLRGSFFLKLSEHTESSLKRV